MDGSIVHVGPGGCGARGRDLALYKRCVSGKGKRESGGPRKGVNRGKNGHLTLEAAVRRRGQSGSSKMIEGLLKIYFEGSRIWPGMIIDVWM